MCMMAPVGQDVRLLLLQHGRGLQHLVEQLQRTVEVNFDPARRLFDCPTRVVGAPALDKRHSQDAQSTKIIDADASTLWISSWDVNKCVRQTLVFIALAHTYPSAVGHRSH